MTLKKATNIVIICFLFSLSWELVRWSLSFFKIVQYQEIEWFYDLWIISVIVLHVGLLIFFITLRKKQLEEKNAN